MLLPVLSPPLWFHGADEQIHLVYEIPHATTGVTLRKAEGTTSSSTWEMMRYPSIETK